MSDYDFRLQQRDPNADNIRTMLLKLRTGQLTQQQIELAARIGCEDSLELCRSTLRIPTKVVDWLDPDGGRRNVMAKVFGLYREWRAALVFYACALVEEYAHPFEATNTAVCRALETRIDDYRLAVLKWHTLSPSEQELQFGFWPPSRHSSFREPGGFEHLPEDQQDLVRRFYQLHSIFTSIKRTENRGYDDAEHLRHEILFEAQDINDGYNAQLILGVADFAKQLLIYYALAEVFPINTFSPISFPC